MGRREDNKLDKRRRIIDATLSLLAETGYEKTTTREIAMHAGVAAGTIFRYAHDKLDLFLMSITEDLDPLTESSFDALDEEAPLLDQLEAFFRPRFDFWARWPELSRVATHQMAAVFAPQSTSPELGRGIKRRDQTLSKLADLLRREERKGRLRAGADVEGLSRIIMYIYIVELRFWLGTDSPLPGDGVRRFKQLAAVALEGAIGR